MDNNNLNDPKLLTDWFAPTVRPVHVGYYDTRTFCGEMVLYWDGDWWRASEHSPSARISSCFGAREWRGLTAEVQP